MDISLTEVPLLTHKIDDPVWNYVIHLLTSPPSKDVTKFGLAVHRYQWLWFAELIRQRWDSKFRVHRMRGQLKETLEKEGAFWVKVLSLTSEVFLLNPAYEHPALWFAELVQEYEISPTVRHMQGSVQTKVNLLKQIRKENQNLLTLEQNPFKQTATRLLLDRAIQNANSKDRFRKQFYTPFVKSRQELTSYAAADGSLILKQEGGKGFISRQGRRKQ